MANEPLKKEVIKIIRLFFKEMKRGRCCKKNSIAKKSVRYRNSATHHANMNESNAQKYWWLAPKYFDELAARPAGLVIVESGLLILIAVTAVCGNVLVCGAMYSRRSLRTKTNHFTLCLAVSDILAATLSFPLSIAPLVKGDWIANINQYNVQHFACKFQATIGVSLASFSLHIMAVTAISRYFRVVRPGLYRKLFTNKSIYAFAAIDCIVILIMHIWPPLTGLARFTFDPRRCACFISFSDRLNSQAAALVYVAMNMLLPLFLMAFCYFRVFRVIRAHQNAVRPSLQNENGNLRTNAQETNTTRIVFVVFLGFLVCWIPIIMVNVLGYKLENPHLPRQPELIFTYCGALSSAVNPIIYGVMNRAFRKEFGRILHCFT